MCVVRVCVVCGESGMFSIEEHEHVVFLAFAREPPLVEPWLDCGWTLVGTWLNCGWTLVGPWWDPG